MKNLKFSQKAFFLLSISLLAFFAAGCSNALVIASGKGNLDEVKKIVESDSAKVNEVGSFDTSPLHQAAFYGRKDVIEYLIAKGANVNAKSGFQSLDAQEWGFSTPLHFAAWQNHAYVAEVLIEHGADVNAKNLCLRTPLHWAAWTGNRKTAVLLISHGADVNAICTDGYTIWNRGGSPDSVESFPVFKLVSRSAEDGIYEGPIGWGRFSEILHEDVSVLHLASYKGQKEVAELLIDNGADVNIVMKDGTTPLFAAARKNRKDMVELLLAKGADINKGSALLAAAYNGGKEVVECLIAHKADLNSVDYHGLHEYGTPLIAALHGRHEDIAKILISNGADINLAWKKELWPLSIATYNGYPEIAKILILKGADVNVRDHLSGETPIFHAAVRGYKEIVELLISHGANVNARDKYGMTPLGFILSRENTNEEMADILRKHGGVK